MDVRFIDLRKIEENAAREAPCEVNLHDVNLPRTLSTISNGLWSCRMLLEA